jgi:hypothetical protein
MAIAIHPYISGQPFRIKYLENVYSAIAKHKGVLHWNGEQILDWYLKARKEAKQGYRPTTIKTPLAMARIAITVPSPEKLRLNSGISPVRISQAASNSIPRFRVIFIGRLP